jgi:hypothetical protein
LAETAKSPPMIHTLKPTLLSKQACQSAFISFKVTRSWGLHLLICFSQPSQLCKGAWWEREPKKVSQEIETPQQYF